MPNGRAAAVRSLVSNRSDSLGSTERLGTARQEPLPWPFLLWPRHDSLRPCLGGCHGVRHSHRRGPGFRGFVDSLRSQRRSLTLFTLTAPFVGSGCNIFAPHIETGQGVPSIPGEKTRRSLRENRRWVDPWPAQERGLGVADRGSGFGHGKAPPIFGHRPAGELGRWDAGKPNSISRSKVGGWGSPTAPYPVPSLSAIRK